MQYWGGKERIAARLVHFMQTCVDASACYVEPFVGGGSVISRVVHDFRLGGDVNAALICTLRSVRDGWNPPTSLSEADYDSLKAARDEKDPMTGFAGFGCSFAGKYFGGYARNAHDSPKCVRNYAANASKSLLKRRQGLRGCRLTSSAYQDLRYPSGCFIYCDPPYLGKTGYGSKFDHSEFWEFFRRKAQEGCMVFVSEYTAPSFAREVWSVSTNLDVRTKQGGKERRVERLFALHNEGNES